MTPGTPAPATRPGKARLALGLLAGWAAGGLAPAALTAAAIGAIVPDPYSAAQQAQFAFLALAGAMALFALILGPALIAALSAAGRRGALAWLGAGAAAGALFGIAAPLATGSETNAAAIAVLAFCGAVLMIVARAVGGIRRDG